MTTARKSLLLALVILAVSLSFSAAADFEARQTRSRQEHLDQLNKKTTRQSIIDNRDKRTEQLSRMLEKTKESVSDHESGRNLLKDDEEYERLKKRIDAYTRKLEKMREPLTEQDIMRSMQRDELRASRRHREL